MADAVPKIESVYSAKLLVDLTAWVRNIKWEIELKPYENETVQIFQLNEYVGIDVMPKNPKYF